MEDTDDSADESADDSLRLRVQLQVQMAARNLMDGGLEELGNLRCKSFPNPAAAPALATAGSIHVVSHEVYRALSLVQRELDELEPGALHAWGDRLVDRDKPKAVGLWLAPRAQSQTADSEALLGQDEPVPESPALEELDRDTSSNMDICNSQQALPDGDAQPQADLSTAACEATEMTEGLPSTSDQQPEEEAGEASELQAEASHTSSSAGVEGAEGLEDEVAQQGGDGAEGLQLEHAAEGDDSATDSLQPSDVPTEAPAPSLAAAGVELQQEEEEGDEKEEEEEEEEEEAGLHWGGKMGVSTATVLSYPAPAGHAKDDAGDSDLLEGRQVGAGGAAGVGGVHDGAEGTEAGQEAGCSGKEEGPGPMQGGRQPYAQAHVRWSANGSMVADTAAGSEAASAVGVGETQGAALGKPARGDPKGRASGKAARRTRKPKVEVKVSDSPIAEAQSAATALSREGSTASAVSSIASLAGAGGEALVLGDRPTAAGSADTQDIEDQVQVDVCDAAVSGEACSVMHVVGDAGIDGGAKLSGQQSHQGGMTQVLGEELPGEGGQAITSQELALGGTEQKSIGAAISMSSAGPSDAPDAPDAPAHQAEVYGEASGVTTASPRQGEASGAVQVDPLHTHALVASAAELGLQGTMPASALTSGSSAPVQLGAFAADEGSGDSQGSEDGGRAGSWGGSADESQPPPPALAGQGQADQVQAGAPASSATLDAPEPGSFPEAVPDLDHLSQEPFQRGPRDIRASGLPVDKGSSGVAAVDRLWGSGQEAVASGQAAATPLPQPPLVDSPAAGDARPVAAAAAAPDGPWHGSLLQARPGGAVPDTLQAAGPRDQVQGALNEVQQMQAGRAALSGHYMPRSNPGSRDESGGCAPGTLDAAAERGTAATADLAAGRAAAVESDGPQGSDPCSALEDDSSGEAREPVVKAKAQAEQASCSAAPPQPPARQPNSLPENMRRHARLPSLAPLLTTSPQAAAGSAAGFAAPSLQQQQQQHLAAAVHHDEQQGSWYSSPRHAPAAPGIQTQTQRRAHHLRTGLSLSSVCQGSSSSLGAITQAGPLKLGVGGLGVARSSRVVTGRAHLAHGQEVVGFGNHAHGLSLKPQAMHKAGPLLAPLPHQPAPLTETDLESCFLAKAPDTRTGGAAGATARDDVEAARRRPGLVPPRAALLPQTQTQGGAGAAAALQALVKGLVGHPSQAVARQDKPPDRFPDEVSGALSGQGPHQQQHRQRAVLVSGRYLANGGSGPRLRALPRGAMGAVTASSDVHMLGRLKQQARAEALPVNCVAKSLSSLGAALPLLRARQHQHQHQDPPRPAAVHTVPVVSGRHQHRALPALGDALSFTAWAGPVHAAGLSQHMQRLAPGPI